MSQNLPFIFGAGGRPPPAQPVQHQQTNQPPSNMQHQSQAAIAQQAAFQQNAQIAGVDMSALQGISPEQLAAIARLFQTGALTLPPPPPEPPSHVPAPSQTLSQVPQSASQPPRLPNGNSTQEQDVDMDKEEGELEEGELGDAPKERDFLRPPPTGPRNRSASPRGPVVNQPRPSKSLSQQKAPNKNKQLQQQQIQSEQAKAHTNGDVRPSKDAEAKAFVLQMVNSGYSFEDLAKELPDPRALIRLFKRLGLPVPSDISSKHPSRRDVLAATQAEPQSNLSSVRKDETRKISVTKRPAPATSDRSLYLAKLQAMKSKKTEPTTTPAAPPKSPEKPTAAVEPAKQIAASDTPDFESAGYETPATTKAEKTELARKRLEALKAQQAARQSRAPLASNGFSMTSPAQKSTAPPSAGRQAVSSPTQPVGLGAGLADIPAKATAMSFLEQGPPQPVPLQTTLPSASASPVFSPPPPTPSRSFSGLPGLFMVATPAQAAPLTPGPPPSMPSSMPFPQAPVPSVARSHASGLPAMSQPFGATPSASPASLNVLRKRPVASDFDDALPKQSAVKRPFGQSRGASEDESIIIEVSDDDDEEDMELDDAISPPTNTNLQTKSFRDVGPLRDFPPKSNFQAQVSGQSTPGVSTPGGATYEQRLKEIEEMKRKIAEAEKRKRNNVAAPVVKTNESVVTSDTSAGPAAAQVQLGANTGSTLDSPISTTPQMNVSAQLRPLSSTAPVSATAMAKKQEKERLMQRLRELQGGATGTVEAASEQPPRVVFSPPKDLSDTVHPVHPAAIPSEIEKRNQSPQSEQGLDLEEGELSDDSMSNIYGTQNAQDTRADPPVAGEEGNVKSQSTTTSSTSHPEMAFNQDDAVTANEGQSQGAIQPDMEVDADTVAQLGIATPVESELPDSLPQDMEMPDPIQEPELLSESMDDDEDEDEDYSDDSDSDDGDLDRPLTNRQTQHAPQEHDRGVESSEQENGSVNNMESLSVSSGNSEDYEPEPVEKTTGNQDLVGKEAAVAAIPAISATKPLSKNDVTDDDLAPELQPTKDEQSNDVEQEPHIAKTHYKPYESVLKDFKDYRWHPDFLQNVPGGFKSMTYSHKIDPSKPLCPFEGAGGICNDRTCPNQHFKDMDLSDNELLRKLGTEHLPIHNQDEQTKWNVGLSAVIKEMRTAKSSRDANAIAARISEFRRNYVGDPTLVLNLG